MPQEISYNTKFLENMVKIYKNMEENAIFSARIAKNLWPPDSNPEIIKACNRQYYSQYEGNYSYFIKIYDKEIDRLFNE